MVMQRRAVIALALMFGSVAPAGLSAQTRQFGPTPETPRMLVMVFASNDKATGVQMADALRTRVQTGADIRRLYVLPKNDITNTLVSSGFPPDSALGPSDTKELAKLLRADEVLGGVVTRSATGLHVEPRLMLARDVTIAQPLPVVESANAGDAARQIERSLGEARKQLQDNKDCEAAVRDKQYPKAVAAARAAIAKYPSATIARLCLANVFADQGVALKTTAPNDSVGQMALADSVLAIAAEITKLDPVNSSSLRLAYTAYQTKHDPESGVRTLVRLFALEPTNVQLQNQVVSELALLGKPSAALPIVDTLLMRSPGDPVLLRQNWLISLRAAAADSGEARMVLLKRALDAGEQMIKIDTAQADSTFYMRQIAAAMGVTDQPQRAVEFASRATQVFANSAPFWFLRAQAERKAGQLQMAQTSVARALTLDPRTPNGSLMLAQIDMELKQVDSALAVAKRGIAAGEDAKTWGAFFLAPTQQAFQAAQASKADTDYQKALDLATESDKMNPSPTAAFFIGVSSFQIGISALQAAQKPKSCPLAKKAQDMFLITQTNMPRGGAIDANVAQQILGYVTQYSPAADQMVKTYCH
jgi:tetratricopeptide (TPR) repeat protein